MSKPNDHRDTTPPFDHLTSLVTKQALEVADTTPADATITQKVIAGLSQFLTTDAIQVVTSMESNNNNALDELRVSLLTMSNPNNGRVFSSPQPQTMRPELKIPPQTPSFAAQFKGDLKKKKRKSDGESSGGSSASLPKKQRLSGLNEDIERLGNVNSPIRLPLEYNTPLLGSVQITSAIAARQLRTLPKKVGKPAKYVYRGVHSLLDHEGCPRSFPALAQIWIEKQQKIHKASGVSREAYDGSFEGSMANDGRGKLGERGFSRTGVRACVLDVVLEGRGEREVELPIRNRLAGQVIGDVPNAAEDEDEQKLADAGTSAVAGSDDGSASSLVGEERKGLTSTERVLESYELLERILLKCGEAQGHDTVLRAQGVSKTFEKVVKRSMKLRQVLLSERRTRGRILA